MKEFKHLSYASSLCGKCSEVCPVKIDIQKMLLLNRRDATELARQLQGRRLWMGKVWKAGMLKRSRMDIFLVVK
jgi:L-lactate dehydrogenase complex protein LldF